MSLHDRKPIELEQGWKYMQVSALIADNSGLKRPLALPAPHPPPATLWHVKEGIFKLKKILEGEKSEVGRLPPPPPLAAAPPPM